MQATSYPTIERKPEIEDIIVIDPLARGPLFNVVALDDLYDGQFIKVEPHDPADERGAFWASATYAKVIDDEPSDVCRCGHPECGAC